MGLIIRTFLVFSCLFVLSSNAYADCAAPAGTAGEIEYQADDVFYFCDGTDWHAMIDPFECFNGPVAYDCTNNGTVCSDAGHIYHNGVLDTMVWCDGSFEYLMGTDKSASGDCLLTPFAATEEEVGALDYDAGSFRYCHTDGWVSAGGLDPTGTVTIVDFTPDAFTFTDLAGQAQNTFIQSDIIQITGVDNGTPITISSASASFGYSKCANAMCSFSTPWTTAPGTIVNNQRLRVRLRSSANPSETTTLILNIGNRSTVWSVQTAP